MLFPVYRSFLSTGVGIALTGVALLLTLILEPLLDRTIGTFFYLAVIVSTWYGGSYPGGMVIILSLLILNYRFVSAFLLTIFPYSLVIHSGNLLRLGIFALVALTIMLLSNNLRASKRQVEQLSRKLQAESAERLKTALNAAQMGMWDWDMVTGQISWSPEHEQLFGLAPGQFDGKYTTFEACLYAPDRAGITQALNQSIDQGIPYHHEFRVVWADGSIHWIEGRGQAFYNRDGKPVRMSGTIMAIDLRKQAELALQQLNMELEQRVVDRTTELSQVNDRLLANLREQQQIQRQLAEKAQLLDLAHDTIMTLDLNWVITFWNQGAERMYGWTATEAIGQVSYTLLHTQFPQPLPAIQAELFEQGYWEGELQHRNRDQQPLIVASRWILQKDEMGRPSKILKINNNITAQKMTERALQQYVTEVEDLYNNAPCGYHSLNADGIIVRINDTELNWLGYSRDEVVFRKKFVDLLTPDAQPIFHQHFPHFKAQGWINNLEFQMLNLDGTTRWVSLNATAIYDEAGNFVMSRSTLFDISDYKQMEAERLQAEIALRESEERRRLALDLTHIGFWDMHLSSETIVWNDNHFTLLGLSPTSHLPNYELWRNCVHPDDLAWIEPRFISSIENHTDYAAEYRVIYPDGSIHWLMGRARALYDAAGNPIRSIGVLLDITDRKQIEAALRQSEETFRSVSEFSPMGIFLCDVTGQCIYTNLRYQQIVGCTSEEAWGEGWQAFIHPEDREWVLPQWANMIATASDGIFNDLRYQDRQGRICYTKVRTAPIKRVDGSVSLFVGMVEDITEYRKIDQMKQEFISVVSHELRTPLTSIRGSLGLVAGGVYDKKPEKMKEMIEIAARQSDRLVRLVNDILDLRRLESGQSQFKFRQCAAIDLIQQSVDVMHTQAEQSQITLVMVPTAAIVWADADAIVQTLTNLLSNAIKFSPPHSTITLAAAAATTPMPAASTVFSIQDQGRGIPADRLEAVFGQFQQVDASDSREKGGTGLGLAICRTIVEQHQGRIWVESTLGQGSTFYFTLPIDSTSADQAMKS